MTSGLYSEQQEGGVGNQECLKHHRVLCWCTGVRIWQLVHKHLLRCNSEGFKLGGMGLLQGFEAAPIGDRVEHVSFGAA